MTAPITGTNNHKRVPAKDDAAAAKRTAADDAAYSDRGESISDAPSDFAGHRTPDYDGDGHISDAEASAFETASSERKHAAELKHDAETARIREDSRNYRAEVAATAEMAAASRGGGKSHGVFGKGGGGGDIVPLPMRPNLLPSPGEHAGDF